jgi:hypothetical protein
MSTNPITMKDINTGSIFLSLFFELFTTIYFKYFETKKEFKLFIPPKDLPLLSFLYSYLLREF